MSIEHLVRENIKALKPYQSARGTYNQAGAVLLDANENSDCPLSDAGGLNRYPDPNQTNLKNKLAKLKNLSAGQIFLSNGSDQAIDYLIRIFCEPRQDKIAVCPPTFGMYKVAAQINDAEVVTVKLKPDFTFDLTAFKAADLTGVKLLFICSPNNPTGNITISREALREVVQKFTGVVVVDEAYIDFAHEHSAVGLLSEFANLIILQTASKAWGLAGVRFGMTYANEEIIRHLNNVALPYNIPTPTTELIGKFLDGPVIELAQSAQIMTALRDQLVDSLEGLSCLKTVFPSVSNFVLAEFRVSADLVYQHLCAEKVVVRNVSGQFSGRNMLRLTVGNQEENRQLIQALRSFA